MGLERLQSPALRDRHDVLYVAVSGKPHLQGLSDLAFLWRPVSKTVGNLLDIGARS